MYLVFWSFPSCKKWCTSIWYNFWLLLPLVPCPEMPYCIFIHMPFWRIYIDTLTFMMKISTENPFGKGLQVCVLGNWYHFSILKTYIHYKLNWLTVADRKGNFIFVTIFLYSVSRYITCHFPIFRLNFWLFSKTYLQLYYSFPILFL